MNIKLITIDLDGTALRKDHKTCSPRLLSALEAAHQQGCMIVPVTGRQYGILPEFLREHPVWESLVVVCNGGQIRKLGTGKVLRALYIEPDALRGMLALARKFDLPIEFSVESTLHLTEKDFEVQKRYANLEFHRNTVLANHGRIVPSLEPLCDAPVEKINLLCIPTERREEIQEELRKLAVCAVWASSSSMEITHPEATKGQSLRALCQMLNIPMEQVMALGDSGNDETMLRQAGLGIAMGNAPDHVKACADAVTETNDNDGAAIAIERYVFA